MGRMPHSAPDQRKTVADGVRPFLGAATCEGPQRWMIPETECLLDIANGRTPRVLPGYNGVGGRCCAQEWAHSVAPEAVARMRRK